MKLTALIPVYNDDYTLSLCLASIADHFDEVIVLDDASTDETPDVAAAFARRYKHVRFMRHEGQQLGWINARNRLLELTDSKLLFYLDSDDVLCEYNANALRRIAECGRSAVWLQLCEMWGDLNHTTQRLKHYDPCHVFVDRRKCPTMHWEGGTCSRLPEARSGLRSPELLFFHIKGVKPDRRLVERSLIRAWMRAGRQGHIPIGDMTEDEIHRRAVKMLLTSRQDKPRRSYPDNPNAPRRPAVIEAAVAGGQRFQMLYDDDGKIVDREDRGWNAASLAKQPETEGAAAPDSTH